MMLGVLFFAMFEQFRRNALAAVCLPALASISSDAQAAPPDAPASIVSSATQPVDGASPSLTIGQWDARGLIPVGIFAGGVAVAAICSVLRGERPKAQTKEPVEVVTVEPPSIDFSRLSDFDSFAEELNSYNRLHTRVSNLEESDAPRTGRAAQFPDMPHDYAFQKAWGPFLHSAGLSLKEQFESLDAKVTNSRFEVAVEDPYKLASLIDLYAERLKATGQRLEPGLVVISKACEEYVLNFLFEQAHKPTISSLLEKMNVLTSALGNAGTAGGAERVDFFRRIYYGNGPVLMDYARFHHACKNELPEEDKYYIWPNSFATARANADHVVAAAVRNIQLVPLALRMLSEFETATQKLLWYTLTPAEEEGGPELDTGSGGGPATLVAGGQDALPKNFHQHDPQKLRDALGFIEGSRATIGRRMESYSYGAPA